MAFAFGLCTVAFALGFGLTFAFGLALGFGPMTLAFGLGLTFGLGLAFAFGLTFGGTFGGGCIRIQNPMCKVATATTCQH
jgi:hypothetical protein